MILSSISTVYGLSGALLYCGYMKQGDADAQFFQMIIDRQNPAAPASDWESVPMEGQLAVDVAENDKEVIIITTVAGAIMETLDVSVQNDMVTIRGERAMPASDATHYYHQECFWGPFSRSIVLPVDVNENAADASYHNGVLTIRIPKHKVEKRIPIHIVED